MASPARIRRGASAASLLAAQQLAEGAPAQAAGRSGAQPPAPGSGGPGHTAAPWLRNSGYVVDPHSVKRSDGGSSSGPFGLPFPNLSDDNLLAIALTLLGLLAIGFALADSMGIGPRHREWRYLWRQRLRLRMWVHRTRARMLPLASRAASMRARMFAGVRGARRAIR